MAEATTYMFTYKELVEMLVKKQDIHEGLWSLRVEFGLAAINVNTVEGSKEITPSALVPLKGIGIQKGAELNSLTVDAAVVNPHPKKKAKQGKN